MDRRELIRRVAAVLKLRYHAQADREPAIGVRPDVLDLEAAVLQKSLKAFDRVFVAVFGMNTFTLIKS